MLWAHAHHKKNKPMNKTQPTSPHDRSLSMRTPAYRLHWLYWKGKRVLANVHVRRHHQWGWRYDVTTWAGRLTLTGHQWEAMQAGEEEWHIEPITLTGAYPCGLLNAAIEHGRIPLTQALADVEAYLSKERDTSPIAGERLYGLTPEQTQAHNATVAQLQDAHAAEAGPYA